MRNDACLLSEKLWSVYQYCSKGLKGKDEMKLNNKKISLMFRGLPLDTFGEIVVLIVALQRSKV